MAPTRSASLGRQILVGMNAATSGSETRRCLTDALRVAAEEVDQDGGDDLDRGVVVVSVERHQARAGYRGRLLGD